MNCFPSCGSVAGLASWAGFLKGTTSFLGSNFGKALVNVGATIGAAYLAKELSLGPASATTGQRQQQGSMTSNGYMNPAGSGFIPQANQGTPTYQPGVAPPAASPDWLIPAAIGFAALVLVLGLRK